MDLIFTFISCLEVTKRWIFMYDICKRFAAWSSSLIKNEFFRNWTFSRCCKCMPTIIITFVLFLFSKMLASECLMKVHISKPWEAPCGEGRAGAGIDRGNIKIRDTHFKKKYYHMEKFWLSTYARVGKTIGQSGNICSKGRKGSRAGKTFLQCFS